MKCTSLDCQSDAEFRFVWWPTGKTLNACPAHLVSYGRLAAATSITLQVDRIAVIAARDDVMRCAFHLAEAWDGRREPRRTRSAGHELSIVQYQTKELRDAVRRYLDEEARTGELAEVYGVSLRRRILNVDTGEAFELEPSPTTAPSGREEEPRS